MEEKTAALGIDIGSVSIKGVTLDSNGRVKRSMVSPTSCSLHETMAHVLSSLARDEEKLAIGVTGRAKSLYNDIPDVQIENDLVSTSLAAVMLYPQVCTILEVGGHGAKWMALRADGTLESFALNDQCAAGSGAFLEQQAGRLKISIEEFSHIAASASRGASIAGRCSVFAKSDMIHLQQKGIPPDEIAYGLCLALARNFRSTLLRGNILKKPALLCGGGALNSGLFRAFREVFEVQDEGLLIARNPQFLGAFGVASLSLRTGRLVSMEDVKKELLKKCIHSEVRKSHLRPLIQPDCTLQPEPVLIPVGEVEAYLGVDLGSVSTDFCLLSPSGKALDGIYLPTRGDPVAVLREGLEILQERGEDRLHILGVGATGSGRHLAGRLLGADVVKNEITCQLLGAQYACPGVDTIIEIGGQDSKFVSVKDGRILDFAMNKICAAGTGSFLEEQADSLGICIREQFAELAMKSLSPADLGRQCTVFMDTEVANSLSRGLPVQDILSGLAYSIVRNYMEKVVAGRPIGSNVVFQGGVASNKAVVSAFGEILGKKITVHPNNRISGAIGAAIASAREMEGNGATGTKRSRFLGLSAIKSADARTFQCEKCSNLCQVTRVTAGSETSCFGDICERYSSKEGEKVKSTVPDLFRKREALLESYAGGKALWGTAGIPRSSFLFDTFPFWSTFLRFLGFRVVLSPPTIPEILERGARRLTAETCLPIKLTFGHVAALLDEKVDFIFLPSIRDLPDEKGRAAPVCPYVESAPFMVSTFARDRLVVPELSLTSGKRQILDELHSVLSSYGATAPEISEAYTRAMAAQEDFAGKLREIGKEYLKSDFPFAFVLLGKPYNCHDPFLNLNLTQHIRKLGILPIPADMLPEADVSLEELGINVPWHYNRQNLRGLLSHIKDRRLFPIIISNFGCGPDAFSMKYLEYLAPHRPHLFLEFDEHRGEAGLITRLEAFIDEIRYHTGLEKPDPPMAVGGYGHQEKNRFKGKRFVIPFFADHARAYAGALKFDGYDVTVLPMPDEETLVSGEEFSSGKECHPYTVLIGDLIKHARKGAISDGDIFFFPGTTLTCLLSQYATGMRMALERLGKGKIELFTPDSPEHIELFSLGGLTRLWRGFVASDLLIRAGCQLRPYASDPGQVDRMVNRAKEEMIDMIASDRLDDMLKNLARSLGTIPLIKERPLPLVGIAGDIYTRIHPFANQDLIKHLESSGVEVWPAPLLTDSVDFSLKKAVLMGINEGKYRDSATAVILLLRKEMESLLVKFQFSTRIDRWSEPGYQETIDLARPYLTSNVNAILLLNVAKMADFITRGADGVINAISFHCMMGTIAASLTESIRENHGMIPITTLIYSGHSAGEIEAKLEAFVHQVKVFNSLKAEIEPPLPLISWKKLLSQTHDFLNSIPGSRHDSSS